MRRNSASFTVLMALAFVLLGSVQFAHAGGLLSRLLSGKKSACRSAPKLRLFRFCPSDPCCPPPVTFCPPSYGGSDCPKQLLMMVSDVDENGDSHCIYRVFLSENCSNNTTLTVNLPCHVNEESCVNGQCGAQGNAGLDGPFMVVAALPMPLPGPSPGPGPGPMPGPGNPGTEGVVVDANPSGLSTGLPPLQNGSTRQVIGVQANPVLAGYYEHADGLGNTRYYALYRLSFVRNNVTHEAGVGFEVAAVPMGGMMLPGQWSKVFNKTHRIDERDPMDINKVVWTYVVHQNQ